MGLVSQFRVHARGIRSGDRLKDRAAIAALVSLRMLSPLWSLLDRVHVRPPSPLGLLRRYRIREGINRWEVAASEGAAYLYPVTPVGTFGEAEENLTGVCIDVGASFGWFTVRWARQLGARGRVLELEPDPRHYPSLLRNIKLNQLNNVVALQSAAGDHEGSLTLFAPAFGMTTFDSSAIVDGGGPKTVVPMRTIDSLCDELELTDIRLVKIDVEGFEPNVLRGMERMMEREHPTVVFEALSPQALKACRA